MKIVKNITVSPITVSDVGVTIPGNDQYLIAPQDYLLWAASSNIITFIGSGDLVINDGSVDLNISDGTSLIKGLFPSQVAVTQVTNPWITNDPSLLSVLNSIAISLGASTTGIYKYQMQSVSSKNETDLSSTLYTVSSGKKFSINNFTATYDAQFTTIVRLKKQTGGSGAFNTLFAIVLEVGGQGQSTVPVNFGNGVIIGEAGDVFKLTYECANSRGNIRAYYTGNEI